MAGDEGLAGSVDLGTLVASVGALEPDVAVYVAREVHERLRRQRRPGPAHGGLAPADVLIGRGGRTRLASPRSTWSPYTAPEVIRGEEPGPPADRYGLGLCLYLMLTGEPPFGDVPGPGALVERVIGAGAPRLSGAHGIPVHLARVVNGLTHRDPTRRPDVDVVLPPLGPEALPDGVWGLAALAEYHLGGPAPLRDPSPPATAVSRQREAVALVLRGEYREAKEALDAVTRVHETDLGPTHLTTLTGRFWQAVCLARLGARGEALALLATINEHAEQGGPGERA